MTSPRTTALVALLITACAVLYTASAALTGWNPPLGWLIQSVIHIGELLAVLALIRSPARPGVIARTGLGAAILGQATLAGAEVIWPRSPDLADALFAIGPTLTGVGLVVVGIPILRGRRWTGWRRFTPIAVGAYVFIVLTPTMIGSGGPPARAALWSIAGWDVLWALMAIAVLTMAPTTGSASHPVKTRAS
ncbi:hypothetical protein [Alloactinosynnema sp. L-07]|uniref:hypothetical protein n=1 Tax=Alloactinosynnema sp. L-07 TaxID=1653480 RepID=UPI0012FC35DF|nr:hypothetical protein [Alloactinosynnema sp. L-07]